MGLRLKIGAMGKNLIVLGALAILACHNEPFRPNTCQVNDPLKDLNWLQDSIASAVRYNADVTVYQASYRGDTVFQIDSFIGIDASGGVIYRCDGSVICRSVVTIAGQSGNCGTIANELFGQTIIYERKR
ncbi:hypothetical protein GCM10027341_17090 [Spirosoma knui]